MKPKISQKEEKSVSSAPGLGPPDPNSTLDEPLEVTGFDVVHSVTA